MRRDLLARLVKGSGISGVTMPAEIVVAVTQLLAGRIRVTLSPLSARAHEAASPATPPTTTITLKTRIHQMPYLEPELLFASPGL
jgi:hypothetical protein